ncbi:unnamed protein product [Echinostoma caproni]|uniref:UBX domain-containing protein n=1 Tax=Echinostoma caproni TaxID=27848 RepID=A0A183B6D4_9TREM|nr:unnamed protein product [Echinostoma caproni]
MKLLVSKAKEKARLEEEERLQRERLARQRDQQQTAAAQRRLAVAATLPREPPAPNTPAAQAFLARPEGAAGITSLRFRLPRTATASNSDQNQTTLLRRFAGLDKLQTVLDYAESQGYPVSDYKLLTTYPRRDVALQPMTVHGPFAFRSGLRDKQGWVLVTKLGMNREYY